MNNSQYEEKNIMTIMSSIKALKILWFITLFFIVIDTGLWVGTVISAIKVVRENHNSISNVPAQSLSSAIGFVFFVFIFAIIILSLLITLIIIQIVVLVQMSNLEPKFKNVSSGIGKILLIIGFFTFIPTIIGAFIVANECKDALAEIRNQDITNK